MMEAEIGVMCSGDEGKDNKARHTYGTGEGKGANVILEPTKGTSPINTLTGATDFLLLTSRTVNT